MENLNDIEKVFGHIGIAIRDSATEMKDVDEVLGELADKWDVLNDVEKNAVATAAAGTRQRENFLVLMNNYDDALRLQEESLNSAGTASEKYMAYQDGIEASLNRLQTTFEEVILKLNGSETLIGLVDFGTDILSVVGNVEVLGGALGLLGGIIASKVITHVKTAALSFREMKATTDNMVLSVNQGSFSIKAFGGQLAGLSAKQKTTILNTIIASKSFDKLTQSQIASKLSALGLSQAEAKNAAAQIHSTIQTKLKTGAVKNLTAAQLGLNAATKAFPLTAIISAITTVIGVVMSMVGSAETAIERWEELNETIASSDQRLADYNTQQTENADRLRELNELTEQRTLSLEEENELLQLQSGIDWLDERIEAEEKLNEVLKERIGIMSDEAFTEAMRLEMTGHEDKGSYDFENVMRSLTPYNISQSYQNKENPWVLDREVSMDWDMVLNSEEGLAKMQEYTASYEQWTTDLVNLETELTEAKTDEDSKRIQNDIKALQEQMDVGAGYIDMLHAGLEQATIFYGENSAEVAEIQNRLFEATMVKLDEQGNAITDSAKYQNAVLSGIFTNMSQETEDALNVLIEAASNGSEIDWDKWFERDEFEEVLTILEGAGIPIKAFTDEVDRMAKELAKTEAELALSSVENLDFTNAIESASYLNTTMGEFATAMGNVTDKIDILTTAQEQLSAVGGITAETLKSMSDNNLLGYLDELYNGTFDATAIAAELEEQTKKTAIAQIYEQGALQLSSLAAAAKAEADGYAISSQDALQIASINAANAIMSTDGTIEDYILTVDDFFGTLSGYGITTLEDFGKYKSMAEDVLADMNAQIAGVKISGYDIESSWDGHSASSSSSSSSGTGSSSSSTDNTDYWKEAFDAEYATLQHKRDMDLISEKEYLDQLDALNKKYFAGRTEYLDEYRDYEKEVYEGRKDELEKQKDAEIEAAEEVYEAQKEAIEKQQEALEQQKDAYQEIIDKRKEMLDSMQEEKDFQDEMTDRNDSILDIENQIAELRFDTSAEGVKKRLELEDELAKAIAEKEEYMYDHSVESQQNALDEEYDNYSKFIDDSIDKLDVALEDLETSFENTTKAIEDSFARLTDALNDHLSALDSSINGAGGTGGSGSFGFNIQNLNGQRGDSVKQAQQALNSQYGGNLDVDGIWGSKTQAAYVRAVQQYLNDNFGANLAVDGIWGSKTQSAWASAGGGAKPFHRGVEEGFVGGIKGNEMFAKLLKGELVTNEWQQDRFVEKILPQIMSNTASAVTNEMNTGVNIEMAFNVAGNMDESVMPNVKNAVKEMIDTYFQRGQKRNVRAFSI